jgi:hypothetical protein
MQMRRAVERLPLRAGIAFTLAVLGACSEATSSPAVGEAARLEPSLARATTSDVKVTGAKPDSTEQGTTLDVTITGSGFTSSSVAEWALRGVRDPNQVRTNSTRYVSSRELVANITVSGTAAIASWDIIVMAGPKSGIGTEMFQIKATTPPATFTYFDQGSEQRLINNAVTPSGFITGDNRDATGALLLGSSVYDNGRCGVESKVFVGGSGDATMDPIGTRLTNCISSVGRTVTLNYGTPIVGAGSPPISDAHFTNVREVEFLPYSGVAGNVAFRRFRLQPRGTTKCDFVRYGTIVNAQHVDFVTIIEGVTVTSKPIRVEAIAPNTWIAASQPDANGRHVAVCEQYVRKGIAFTAAYDIPFRIQVVMHAP